MCIVPVPHVVETPARSKATKARGKGSARPKKLSRPVAAAGVSKKAEKLVSVFVVNDLVGPPSSEVIPIVKEDDYKLAQMTLADDGATPKVIFEERAAAFEKLIMEREPYVCRH